MKETTDVIVEVIVGVPGDAAEPNRLAVSMIANLLAAHGFDYVEVSSGGWYSTPAEPLEGEAS